MSDYLAQVCNEIIWYRDNGHDECADYMVSKLCKLASKETIGED